MANCSNLNNNSCKVASSLAGSTVTVTPRTCLACTTKTDSPRSLNVVTCSIAYQVAPSPGLLETLAKLHRETTFNKPGTCLKNILKRIGVVSDETCQCDAFANEMDVWGTAGCVERRSEIVSHLNNQYISWLIMLRVALAGYFTTRQLVDECIKQSKVIQKAKTKKKQKISDFKPFEKVFIINLPFKKDRLERIVKLIPQSISSYEVWPAIHGDSVKPPKSWHAPRGAWGCYRSHMQILEHCMANGIESYLVLEDDAIFSEDFCEVLAETMKLLPDDWCQLYLGGQLLHERKHPPNKINEFVYSPYNVNRTHCFALHQRGYQRVYDHLFELPFHQGDQIDHRLGRLHETGAFPVYCSRRWIVGQNDGTSDINTTNEKPIFWDHPEDVFKEDFKPHTCRFGRK
jgi:hypothetical protein